ncbi:hypothetical protein GRI35_13375 [Altererythrobacter aestiaquae]|uniref:Uncharacterized protein n=1 Tax=Pontixanthobacter aestiaquae TaxID=1509367 RepID=A0A844Z6V0_9SPHN|nr:hypothetical protein [Pontixanthobacter aestiaquae]MXO84361.1 hypothetical protein [Pontixanthobacter aestiaquae]
MAYDQRLYCLPQGAEKEPSCQVELSIKNFRFVEDFENAYIAYIHLMAVYRHLEDKKLRVFSLKYDPVFDVYYNGCEVILKRKRFVARFEHSVILEAIMYLVDNISEAVKSNAKSLAESLELEVEKAVNFYNGIKYAV